MLPWHAGYCRDEFLLQMLGITLHFKWTLNNACCSVAQSCPTLCDSVDCRTPGFPVLHHLLELAQTHVHWIGDAIQPSCPLSSPSPLPSIFPNIRVFSSESSLHIRWPKYWSFSLSLSPSSEYSGLISFRIDWLDLLAVPGTLQVSSPAPQFKSTQHSAFFMVWLSHPYLTTGKAIAVTIWTFGGKVMSLLFNASRFVTTLKFTAKATGVSYEFIIVV